MLRFFRKSEIYALPFSCNSFGNSLTRASSQSEGGNSNKYSFNDCEAGRKKQEQLFCNSIAGFLEQFSDVSTFTLRSLIRFAVAQNLLQSAYPARISDNSELPYEVGLCVCV